MIGQKLICVLQDSTAFIHHYMTSESGSKGILNINQIWGIKKTDDL